MTTSVPFQSVIRSSGAAEVWTHAHEDLKLTQFGWRCTTKESSYGKATLIGNWNEDRSDIDFQKHAKRLPSQFEHYFESTHGKSYNTEPPLTVPKSLVSLKARTPHGFPSHQPELDLPQALADSNSWQTTSRAAFINPQIRRQPLS